jgi:hypothetical protein
VVSAWGDETDDNVDVDAVVEGNGDEGKGGTEKVGGAGGGGGGGGGDGGGVDDVGGSVGE